MTAKTVSIAVQLGTGGFSIARSVADKLGYRYYDWEITSQAAEEAGVSPEAVASAERLPSLVERILERYFASGFLAGDLPDAVGPTSVTMDSALQTMSLKDYRDMIQQVVVDLGERGDCVIVNHSAQILLKDRRDTLKVLIHGGHKGRAMRLALEESLSPDEALRRIQHNDSERAAFFKHYYHVNWLDAKLYDLTINTSNLRDETAVSLVVETAQRFLDPVHVSTH
jgi:cytidylate kinase